MALQFPVRPAILGATLLALATLPAAAAGPAYPAAEKKPVTDTVQGVQVTDDYRWMENADDPAVKAWSAAQTKVAREALDAMPVRASVAARFRELFGSAPVRYFEFHQRAGVLRDEAPAARRTSRTSW